MDFFPKYLNEITDSSRAKRLSSYKRLLELSEERSLSESYEFELIRSCLRGFEDSSERCREYAINIVATLLPRQSSSVLDWVLPAVVTRIGVLPVVEESEELRLLLLRISVACMDTFPHEIGPRNYIDFFQVLLENCMRDPFPELKKEACRACVRLCEIEPVQVKHIAVPLAKVVKNCCLLHKHGLVRVESVNALASLIEHGASEILCDAKDEQESRTTVNILFILANDHSESVRCALVNLLSTVLLDIVSRQDHHRRLLPHLLLLTTDQYDAVSSKAQNVLESMGKLYLLDNEDNSIDITKRRVTMKDIEWYGDDEYPDLSLSTVDKSIYTILQKRPSLGARHVVADAFRGFVDKLFTDIAAIDWVIPFSSNNRRVVALRILWLSIYHVETSVVQLLEQIMGILYKSIKDNNDDVAHESLICVELLGKFLTPKQYLPFLTGEKNSKQDDDDSTLTIQSRSKTIVLSSVSNTTTSFPTIFSTAALSVRCGILIALRYLVEGSKHLLTASDVTQMVRTLTCNDTLDCDNEGHLCALVDTLIVLVRILGERDFIATPKKPLPREVVDNLQQRTLDSIIFYALLCLRTCQFPTVQDRVSQCIGALSVIVTGETRGIYALHLGRLLNRYGSKMPDAAFSDLVLNSESIGDVTEELSNVFLAKLSNVNFTNRATGELKYIGVLEQLLWRKSLIFSRQQQEDLLRAVILPLSGFHPGGTARLFRKVAISCLCAILEEEHRAQLEIPFTENDFALSSKIVTAWCSATDADDPEMRLLCLTSTSNICRIPMNAGSTNDVLQSILLRLDDSSDVLRLKAAKGLSGILEDKALMCPIVIDQMIYQTTPIVKKVLIHIDDLEESVGLRPVLLKILKEFAVISPSVVFELVQVALSKHQDTTYCKEVLSYIDSM